MDYPEQMFEQKFEHLFTISSAFCATLQAP